MKTLLLITASFCLWVSTGNAANVVTNGGFETGDLTGWTSGLGCNNAVGNSNPHSGSFAYRDVTFGVSCLLSQSVTTTPGADYVLDFWLFNQGSTQPNSFSAIIDGTPKVQLTNSAAFGYTHYIVPFTAANATTQLAFAFRHNDNFWYMDDVVVDSSTPEPASIGLLAAGAGLFALLRRRQQAL